MPQRYLVRGFSPSVFCCRKAATKSSFAPSPLSAHASASLSRVRGRQRLAFLAASATGGARKPNPSEGAEGAPAPYTDLPQAALRRSYARRRRAALIRHGAGCAAPRHLPQGEGYVLRTEHTHKHFARRAKYFTHAAGVDFTAPKARFHTAAKFAAYHYGSQKQLFTAGCRRISLRRQPRLGGFLCAKK